MTHLTKADLEAGLDVIRRSPGDEGLLHLIVRRPEVGGREVLNEGELDGGAGLAGDNWKARARSPTPGASPPPDTQITLMNSRVIALMAQEVARWPLSGDQLFVDLDLSVANLEPGTRLALGTAVIEISDEPHTGCGKFVARFGLDAMKFVNSPLGRQLRLRGIYAKVVQRGVVRIGDIIRKLPVERAGGEHGDHRSRREA
jgi:hypothetical protein